MEVCGYVVIGCVELEVDTVVFGWSVWKKRGEKGGRGNE